MAEYIGALDQGTTSTRFMVFDHRGEVVSSHQEEHRQIFPQPGWVEHDATEIWQRSRQVIGKGLDRGGLRPADLAAVGITNQRETAVVWDRATGRPIHNAIVWQDTRTAALCDELALQGGPDRFRSKTGLPLATYFAGPKVSWLLDHVAGARERAEAGELPSALSTAGNCEHDGRSFRRPAFHRCDQCLEDPPYGPDDPRLG